ncbi:hypothetical protein J7J90_04140 [Candidatus Micrarchaeota archaeon]|nr:hypothetical protein [Candidatus Micrarchaeota archaeon]
METVICDASSLIALSDTCDLGVLRLFRKKVNFVIPKMVEYECITRPMSIKQYSIHAYKLQHLVEKKIITVIDEDDNFLKRIMDLGNHIFYRKGKPIHLIDKGECGMIASAVDRDIRYMLIDERTTRTLIEAPEVLKKHLEDEFHVNIMVNIENLEEFKRLTKNIKILRSSELVIMAYKKGYFDSYENPKQFLSASLYKLKYTGCALSFDEIEKFISTL